MSDSLKLFDPNATFDATIPRNASGVPLVLVAKSNPSVPGAVDVDYSQVPVTPFDAAIVATLTTEQAQAAMDALVAKYDGVQCEQSAAHGATQFDDEDQFTMAADWPYLTALEKQGADRILAHQHHAASTAPAQLPQQPASPPPPPATPAAPSTSQPTAPAKPNPDPAAPSLVLNQEQHAQVHGWLQELGDEAHHLGSKAHAAYSKLVALLHLR